MPRVWKPHPIRTATYYQREYIENERSMCNIAREFKVPTITIQRELRRLGFTVRGYDDANKLIVKYGLNKRPHLRKIKRPPEICQKISESARETWEKLSAERRQERISKARSAWRKSRAHEKRRLKKFANDDYIGKSSKNKSLSQYLWQGLANAGYQVHKTAEDLPEVNCYLPRAKTAIEVLGPSHYLPVWGEENLQKTMLFDMEKATIIQGQGRSLIRIKNMLKCNSKMRYGRVLARVLQSLEEIACNRGKTFFFEIEAK